MDVVGEVEKPRGRVQGRARSGLEEGGGFPALLVRQPCLSEASSLPYTPTLVTGGVGGGVALTALSFPYNLPVLSSHFTTMITVRLVP